MIINISSHVEPLKSFVTKNRTENEEKSNFKNLLEDDSHNFLNDQGADLDSHEQAQINTLDFISSFNTEASNTLQNTNENINARIGSLNTINLTTISDNAIETTVDSVLAQTSSSLSDRSPITSTNLSAVSKRILEEQEAHAMTDNDNHLGSSQRIDAKSIALESQSNSVFSSANHIEFSALANTTSSTEKLVFDQKWFAIGELSYVKTINQSQLSQPENTLIPASSPRNMSPNFATFKTPILATEKSINLKTYSVNHQNYKIRGFNSAKSSEALRSSNVFKSVFLNSDEILKKNFTIVSDNDREKLYLRDYSLSNKQENTLVKSAIASYQSTKKLSSVTVNGHSYNVKKGD